MAVNTGSTTELEGQIEAAFAPVPAPPAWCLSNSREGEEPALLEQEFRELHDWRLLTPEFLDRTPGGFASALSFFSDEAFRFYLPAYLLADLRGQLQRADVLFHLTHGLDNQSRDKLVNPIRYGSRTWFDAMRHRFSIFDKAQREVIARYLEYRERVADIEPDRRAAREALDNYWRARA
ncbi:MAG TPA: DUF6714 family protein [Gemmatimonadaceae bacterium]|nr:DUF6714 family protein [Gemmatimonadaceae bacterium]